MAELKARRPEVFVNVDRPTAGSALQSGAPFIVSEAGVDYARPSPLFGQHTDHILSELGFTTADITQLRESKVVA